MWISRILTLIFSFWVGALSAADCGSVSCNALAQPVQTAATVLVNVSWDATGINGVNGSHTTYCCANIIVPSGYTKAEMLLHGGGGDNYDILLSFGLTTKATTSFTVTNAVWSSTYGGSTVFTVSTDPTAGTYGPTITVGNVFATLGIRSTGGSGAGFNSGLSSPWTVIGVHGGSAPYTVTIAQTAASSPGTFSGNGTGYAFTLSPSNVNTANVGTRIIAAPQGLSPLGGTDNANTAVFNGTAALFTLTASAPSSGVITTSQTVSSTNITDSPTVFAHGTGQGWAGTYTLSKSESASEAMTANGCPTAANNETWSNWNSTSCRDDVTAIDALAKGLQAAYTITAKNADCLGHSEGSGMCLREMWEHGDDFGNFGGVSMPFSLYYDSAGGGHTTLPTTKHHWWTLVGAKDPVVCLDVADNSGCNGTANTAHVTIALTALTAQSVDSGALTPGNLITSGAANGTYITACSDATHCTVSISQTISPSTAITMNNSYSNYIYNNSNNQSAANLQFPLPTQWLNYVNSQATWANGLCSAGFGSQLPVANGTVSAVTTGYIRVFDSCSGNIEYNELSDAGHDMGSLTRDWGGDVPAKRFATWSDAHPPP